MTAPRVSNVRRNSLEGRIISSVGPRCHYTPANLLLGRSCDQLNAPAPVSYCSQLIAYDSDNEMGRRRAELTHNKRGTKLYSKEDIREQYCLSDRQADRLNKPESRSIFSCFADKTTGSGGAALLSSCYRGEEPSDQDPNSRPLPRPVLPHTQQQQQQQQQQQRQHHYHSLRRPAHRSFCYSDPKRFTLAEGELLRFQEGYPGLCVGDANLRRDLFLHGYDLRQPPHARCPYNIPPDWGHQWSAEADLSTTHNKPISPGAQPKHQKHVSFDSHLYRSQTLSSIEDQTQLVESDASANINRSQERLIDGRRPAELLHREAASLLAPFITRAILQDSLKRASTRTQSTQTDRRTATTLPVHSSHSQKRMRSRSAQTHLYNVGDEENDGKCNSDHLKIRSGICSSRYTETALNDDSKSLKQFVKNRLTFLPQDVSTMSERCRPDQEIIIDYEPSSVRHLLLKTRSEGEIIPNRQTQDQLASAMNATINEKQLLIQNLTVSESDLLELSPGRCKSLGVDSGVSDFPPPLPPRDYQEEGFHELLIENITTKIDHGIVAPPIEIDTELLSRDYDEAKTSLLSLSRSTYTMDSLTGSQETVAHHPGSGGGAALQVLSDSDISTPCSNGSVPKSNHAGTCLEVRTSADASRPGVCSGLLATTSRACFPARQQGSDVGLSVTELSADDRSITPNPTVESWRLGDSSSAGSPAPLLDRWNKDSPAPSQTPSATESDEEKHMEKFMLSLSDGFDVSVQLHSEVRSDFNNIASVEATCNIKSQSHVVDAPCQTVSASEQRTLVHESLDSSSLESAQQESIPRHSCVESLFPCVEPRSPQTSESNTSYHLHDGTEATVSSIFKLTDKSCSTLERSLSEVKQCSRFFEENDDGEFVEVPEVKDVHQQFDDSNENIVPTVRVQKKFIRQLTVSEPSYTNPKNIVDGANTPGSVPAVVFTAEELHKLQSHSRERRHETRLRKSTSSKSNKRNSKQQPSKTSKIKESKAVLKDEPGCPTISLVSAAAMKGSSEETVCCKAESSPSNNQHDVEQDTRCSSGQYNEQLDTPLADNKQYEEQDARSPDDRRDELRGERCDQRDKLLNTLLVDSGKKKHEDARLADDQQDGKNNYGQRNHNIPENPPVDRVLTADGKTTSPSPEHKESNCTVQTWHCSYVLRLKQTKRRQTVPNIGVSTKTQLSLLRAYSISDLRSISDKRDFLETSGFRFTEERSPIIPTDDKLPHLAGKTLATVAKISQPLGVSVPETLRTSISNQLMQVGHTEPKRVATGEDPARPRADLTPVAGICVPRPELDISQTSGRFVVSPVSDEPDVRSDKLRMLNRPLGSAVETLERRITSQSSVETDTSHCRGDTESGTRQDSLPESLPTDPSSEPAVPLRRRRAEPRPQSAERVLDERAPIPLIEVRAKSEERTTTTTDQSSVQSTSYFASQESSARPTDVSTQSTLSLAELTDDEDGLYTGYYPAARWLYIGAGEERRVWRQTTELTDECSLKRLQRTSSTESTESEKTFRRRYQAISHRMVHRKSSMHMLRLIQNHKLEANKLVRIEKSGGEFGFRIHGSRPVVVSAIETGTPAEMSGLEVGDIILSINGAPVLESGHGDVVRTAHSVPGQLVLQVVSVGVAVGDVDDGSDVAVSLIQHADVLWRRSNADGTWHRRWAVLRPDSSLYFYTQSDDVHPVGALCLTDCRVTVSSDCGRQMALAVCIDGSDTEYVAAESDTRFLEWQQKLSQSTDRGSQDWSQQVVQGMWSAPNDIGHVDCRGFLQKLGCRWRSWRRHYCVLRDGVLYLYGSETDSTASSAVYLHGYRVQGSSGSGSKTASFEISPPTARLRHFYFRADSDTDKKRWLAALEYSIDRWIRMAR